MFSRNSRRSNQLFSRNDNGKLLVNPTESIPAAENLALRLQFVQSAVLLFVCSAK